MYEICIFNKMTDKKFNVSVFDKKSYFLLFTNYEGIKKIVGQKLVKRPTETKNPKNYVHSRYYEYRSKKHSFEKMAFKVF